MLCSICSFEWIKSLFFTNGLSLKDVSQRLCFCHKLYGASSSKNSTSQTVFKLHTFCSHVLGKIFNVVCVLCHMFLGSSFIFVIRYTSILMVLSVTAISQFHDLKQLINLSSYYICFKNHLLCLKMYCSKANHGPIGHHSTVIDIKRIRYWWEKYNGSTQETHFFRLLLTGHDFVGCTTTWKKVRMISDWTA